MRHSKNVFFMFVTLLFTPLSLFMGHTPISPIQAASQPICPSDILLSLGRSGSACFQIERDEVCYGNGDVSAEFNAEAGQFQQPGDIISVDTLRQLNTSPIAGDISVTTMLFRASLAELEERSVVMLLFGDATVTNLVPLTPEIVLTATGSLNIRAIPGQDEDIIERLSINETVVANGVNEDGDWLRVKVPNSEDLGWVARDVVSTEGDLSTLAVVTVDTPVFQPFENLEIQTGDEVFCDGNLPSGILLQTPNTFTPVEMNLNGVDVAIAASVFLEADATGSFTLYVLDGTAEIRYGDEGDEVAYIPAGTYTQVTAEGASMPEGYENSAIAALPVNNLPYRFTVAEPLSPEGIAEALAALQTEEEEVVEATQPIVTARPQCIRRVRIRTTTWSGPAEFYEAVNAIPDNERVYPVLQTANADGEVWYQLNNSNWINSDRVYEEGECEPLPVVDQVPPPTVNRLLLETCESQNGPLRVGQRVTIEFTPPAWDTYGEAIAAVRTDPGRILVDEQRLTVTASDPYRLGMAQDRYVRTFRAIWTAEGGPFRIEGDWLSYELSCEITVPFG